VMPLDLTLRRMGTDGANRACLQDTLPPQIRQLRHPCKGGVQG